MNTSRTTARRRALEALVVVLLVVAGWLAYTGFNATTTVATYNNQPGQIAPELNRPAPTPSTTTQKETNGYV